MTFQHPAFSRTLRTHFTLGLLVCGWLCTAIGCGLGLPEPARKLIGTWELDQPDRLAARINQLPPENQLPAATPDEEGAQPNGPGMVLEFRADGSLLTRTALGQLQQQKQGTWRFVSASGDGQTLAIRCVLNQQTSELEVKFLETGGISLVPPNLAGLNTELRFRRAQ